MKINSGFVNTHYGGWKVETSTFQDISTKKELNFVSNLSHAWFWRAAIATFLLLEVWCVCWKKGYIARVCRSKLTQPHPQYNKQLSASRKPPRATNLLRDDIEDPNSDSDSCNNLYSVSQNRIKPLVATVKINDATLQMEIDTGASISLISKATFDKLWVRNSVPDLRPSDVLLKTYTGEPLQVCGAVDVEVTYNEQTVVLPFVVVESKGPTLLGCDWLQHLKLDWTSCTQLVHPRIDAKIQKCF